MKYIFPLFLFSIILSGILFAFKNNKPKPKNTILWEIKHPQFKYRSYIFGTIHLIEKEYFIFPKQIQKYILKSDKVILELPGIPTPDQLEPFIYNENGQNVLSHFSTDQKQTLLQWVKKNLQLNEDEFIESYGKFKPFILAQTITQFAFLDKTVSYEREIIKTIKNKDISLEGLETTESQISLFASLPIQKQIQMVLQAIDSSETNKSLLKLLQQAYKEQDLDKIHQLIQEESIVTATDFNYFVTDRNLLWIKPLSNYFKNGKNFVAVGAGHLAGENGILNLLRKEGYRTKAIYLK